MLFKLPHLGVMHIVRTQRNRNFSTPSPLVRKRTIEVRNLNNERTHGVRPLLPPQLRTYMHDHQGIHPS